METARFSLMGQSRVKYMPSNKWQHLRLGGGMGGTRRGASTYLQLFLEPECALSQ